MISVCANVYFSACVCVSYAFSSSPPFIVCFPPLVCMSYSGLFYFTLILLFVFDGCLFSNKKRVDLYGWGRRKDLGRVRGGEITIRIYGMKKIYFQLFLKSKRLGM